MNGLSAANHVQAYIRWLKLGKTIKLQIAIKFSSSLRIKHGLNSCVRLTITAEFLLNVCGRYRVADIDLWPISTLLVANIWSSMWPIWLWPIWSVADIDVILR